MVSRFSAWTGRAASDAALALRAAPSDGEREAAWQQYHPTNAFRLERMQVALAELPRLAAEAAAAVPAWQEQVAAVAGREEQWVAGQVTSAAVFDTGCEAMDGGFRAVDAFTATGKFPNMCVPF